MVPARMPVRAGGTGDTVPVLTTIGQDWASARLRWGETSVAVHPAGVAPALPALAVDGPVILVDRATLAAAVGQELPATRALVAGPEADARAYLVLRPYVRTAVQVDLADPADPAPYWLISSRHPKRLADALVAAASGAAPRR